jgi:hypothetical protein
LITGNSSTAGGGGIYLYSGSDAKITDVIIKDNIGGWGGGGMYIEGSDAELTNVQIHSNDDGGVKLQASDVYFDHVTISDNESYGMHIEYSAEPTFNHVTIVNNDTYGIGLYSTWSHPVITNSIIANNGTQVTTNQSTGPYGISISYSNIQGGPAELDSLGFHPDSVNWGEGNIDADPLFCSSNSSLSFDGSDDYVSIPHNELLNIGDNGGNQGTVMAYIKLGDTNENDYLRIISKKSVWDNPDGYELEINPGQNIITLTAGNQNFGRGSFIPTNNWVHVAATFNDNAASFYLNGIDITIDGDIDPISGNSLPLWIGKVTGDDTTAINAFNGSIDDVALYNVQLSQNQIQEIISNGITVNENVVGYWNFNEGTGATLTDQTSSGNNGTINGATWSTDTPEMGSYTLAENSPCVGSGQDGTNMGAYGVGCSAILAVEEEFIPMQFAIHQNYPNPFNPVTTIRYELPENGLVNIIIYDILGRRVKTLISQTQTAGHRSVQWNATNDYGKPVSAGVYIYQIQAGKHINTKKMLLLK